MIHQFYLPDHRSFLYLIDCESYLYYLHKVYTVCLIIYLYICIIFYISLSTFYLSEYAYPSFLFHIYQFIYLIYLTNAVMMIKFFPEYHFQQWTKECTCYPITHNAFLFYCSSLKEREKRRRASEFQESNIINRIHPIQNRNVLNENSTRRVVETRAFSVTRIMSC